jgi:RimJ/RimL family protein N-acetyltransferase
MQSRLILRGPRLRLRPWRPDDVPAAVEWNNDPTSLRFADAERRDEPYRPYDAAEIEMVYRAVSSSGWMFIAMLGNRRAGEFSLTLNGPEPGSARIDLIVAPAFRGRGLAREGLAVLARFAFEVLRVPALYGYVTEGNVDSERLHRSLGYRRHVKETKRPFVLTNTPAARARLRKLVG